MRQRVQIIPQDAPEETGEQRLAKAFIGQIDADLQGATGTPLLTAWASLWDQQRFSLFCAAAGRDPTYVREKFLKRLRGRLNLDLDLETAEGLSGFMVAYINTRDTWIGRHTELCPWKRRHERRKRQLDAEKSYTLRLKRAAGIDPETNLRECDSCGDRFVAKDPRHKFCRAEECAQERERRRRVKELIQKRRKECGDSISSDTSDGPKST